MRPAQTRTVPLAFHVLASTRRPTAGTSLGLLPARVVRCWSRSFASSISSPHPPACWQRTMTKVGKSDREGTLRRNAWQRQGCADRGRSRLLNSNELQGLLPFDIPPHLVVAPWMLTNRPVPRNCLHGDSALPPERVHKVGEVFGINRELPVNYVSRQGIDDKLIDNLTRDHHIVIFGAQNKARPA